MGNWFNEWLVKVQNVDWGQAVATFFTGIIVVFAALIVLVVIFWAFGKIMKNAGKPREKKKEEPLAAPAPPNLVEVVSDDGLSDEVVAAITGAVSVIISEEGNNGSFVIKSIKRTRQTSSAWGTAGVIENTRPLLAGKSIEKGIETMFETFMESIQGLLSSSGFLAVHWQELLMIAIACFLAYLAIAKGYEPLLLLPIAFGMLLTNIPNTGLFHMDFFIENSINFGEVLHDGGLLDILYLGVKLGIYPPLIFLGIGTMTDFGPLIANPKSFLLGAAAQLGIFVTFFGALAVGFSPTEAGGISIIGGADGPTAILVAKSLAPHLLGSIAVAAYSYMALVPVIQPPIMKLLTTKKERSVVMEQLRPVSRVEKLMFPFIVTLLVSFLVPDAAPLMGMLMLGNLMRESGVVDRLVKTAQNELMNIITIFLGVTVGATATAKYFLTPKTLLIIVLGLLAFCIGTAGGVLFGKLMYVVTKGKVNPLIGSAGVSAVPMAARVSQKVGAETDPTNFLLMHAMGPNVAGVIGSAIAAGVLLSIFA